jgi:hypothetical protein
MALPRHNCSNGYYAVGCHYRNWRALVDFAVGLRGWLHNANNCFSGVRRTMSIRSRLKQAQREVEHQFATNKNMSVTDNQGAGERTTVQQVLLNICTQAMQQGAPFEAVLGAVKCCEHELLKRRDAALNSSIIPVGQIRFKQPPTNGS